MAKTPEDPSVLLRDVLRVTPGGRGSDRTVSLDQGDGTRLRAGVGAAGVEGIPAALLGWPPREGREVRAPTWHWLLPATPSGSQGPELRRGLTPLPAIALLTNGPSAAVGPPGRENQPWGCIISRGEGPSSPEHCVDTLCQAVRRADMQKGDFLHRFLNCIKF